MFRNYAVSRTDDRPFMGHCIVNALKTSPLTPSLIRYNDSIFVFPKMHPRGCICTLTCRNPDLMRFSINGDKKSASCSKTGRTHVLILLSFIINNRRLFIHLCLNQVLHLQIKSCTQNFYMYQILYVPYH